MSQTVIRDMTAHMLVRRPVLTVKIMMRLMIVSERWKPVRERWRRKMRTNAILTSDTALSTLTTRERLAISSSWVNVVN